MQFIGLLSDSCREKYGTKNQYHIFVPSRLHRRAINYKVIYDQPYIQAKLWSELSTLLKATLRVSDLSFGSPFRN